MLLTRSRNQASQCVNNVMDCKFAATIIPAVTLLKRKSGIVVQPPDDPNTIGITYIPMCGEWIMFFRPANSLD